MAGGRKGLSDGTRAAEKRRPPPLGAQLEAAKRQIVILMQRLGTVPADIPVAAVTLECDHDPALGLRDVDPATGHHVPHQHDPAALIFRPKIQHDAKTRGTGATTAGSDVGEMRKTRQLVRARVERGEVAADDPSIAPWAPNPSVYRPPKRRIAGPARKSPRNPASSRIAKLYEFSGDPRP